MAFMPDYRSAGMPGATAQAGAIDAGLRAYMLRIYNWMASGVLLTGLVAYGVAHTGLRALFYHVTPNAYGNMQLHPTLLGYASIFAPLAFVLVLSFGVNRLSRGTAQALFWAFCAVMGASLTNIFFIYTDISIVQTFFITAATFAGMSLYGYTTGRDLSRFGSFLMMGLIGIMIAGLVNLFLHSPMVQFVVSVIGVLVFVGLTAFDTQRIKWNYTQNLAYAGGGDVVAKAAVYDSLSLYLNFINLFTLLLQFTGSRRD